MGTHAVLAPLPSPNGGHTQGPASTTVSAPRSAPTRTLAETIMMEAIGSLSSGAGPASGTSGWSCDLDAAPSAPSTPSTSASCSTSAAQRAGVPSATAPPTPVAWQDVSPTVGTAPSARVGAAMSYDPGDGYVLFYGGGNGAGTAFFHDTWSFSNGVWTNLTSSVGTPPPGRVSPSMAYDTADGYMVLYGGLTLSGGGTWLDDLSDTWKFSGGAWTNITTSAGTPPSGRFSMGLGYDPSDHELVGFGGEQVILNALGATATMDGGTWAFSGGSWRNLVGTVSTPPSARAGVNMAYDAADGYLLMYGGLWESISGTSVSGYETSDTWSFSSGFWLNRTSAVTGTPGDLALSGMAYDSGAKEVVMFGGCVPPVSSSCPLVNTTWAYHADRWTDVSPLISVAPSARASVAMSNDTHDGYLLLFGGSCGSAAGCALGDTWTENGAGSTVHPITFTSIPVACGPIQFDGLSLASGTTVGAATGTGSLSIGACPPDNFVSWNVSGGLSLSAPHSPSTQVAIWGTGSLSAWFVGPLHVNLTTSAHTVGLNASSTLDATTWGGVGPYSYLWSLNGTNTSAVQDPYTVTFVHAGNYTYGCWAIDSRGTIAWGGSSSIQVLSYTPKPLGVNVSATSYYPPTGSTIYFTATTTGGTISTYSWTENGTQSLPCSGPTCPIYFPHGGTYPVAVTVVDSLGRSATDSTRVSVYTYFTSGPPAPLTLTLKSNLTTAYVGEPIAFTGTPAGGIGTYHGYVFWMNGTGNSSPMSSGQFDHAFTSAATYTVQLWVFDSAGEAASSNKLTITVQPDPSGPSSSPGIWETSAGGIPILALALVMVVVLIVAAVALLVARSRRRRSSPPQGPQEAYEGPSGPQAPPQGWEGGMAPSPYGAPGYPPGYPQDPYAPSPYPDPNAAPSPYPPSNPQGYGYQHDPQGVAPGPPRGRYQGR